MKKILAAAAMAAAILPNTQAEVGVVEATGQFSVNGTTTTYLSSVGAASNPRWGGYDFGDFNLSIPNTLTFQNFFFQNYAYNGGTPPVGAPSNNNWLDNDKTASLTLFRNGTAIATRSLTQSGVSGNNRTWNISGGATINLLDGITTTGRYNYGFIVDWNFNTFANGVTTVNSTSTVPGSDAFLDVTVIPEPSTYALLGLSAAAFTGYVIRRRRRW